MSLLQPSRVLLFISIVILSCGVLPVAGEQILVEAEGFDDVGGWVIDQQFMDQMGSPMLLAHGMGVPVKDAVTSRHNTGGAVPRLGPNAELGADEQRS